MLKKPQAEVSPAQLFRYREERSDEPQFYYNELADRGRALAELRALLENFRQGRTGLAEFTRQLAGRSRREVSAARGRAATRYWRFNSAGRLFIETIFKQAEQAGRLNAAGIALQALLGAPATLDAAGQQLEAFSAFLDELDGPGNPSRDGLSAYVASYFWAVQQPQWPVYERVAREQLARSGYLDERSGDRAAGKYSGFYLAFTRLAQELEVYNYWELESFLHWLARRDLTATRLLATRANRSVRHEHRRTAELLGWLEPALRAELGESFSGTAGENGRLVLAAPERPFRLELRSGGKPSPSSPEAFEGWLAGIGFDGFGRAALATPTGETTLAELRGFLASRPEYHFYDANFKAQPEPGLEELADEFWLLRSLPTRRGASQLEELVNEWRLLYPFACRLVAAFEEESAEESPAGFTYEAPEPELPAVAETPASYSYAVEPALPPEDEALPAPAPLADEVTNAEVLRLARLKPPALSSDQLEALIAYIKERLIITPEKITEVVTHLEAGRNLLLYGPPGSGKTRLARLIAGQMGAPDPGWASESEASNYSLTTATAEWSQYDTIGGIRPGLVGESSDLTSQSLFYYFEPGVVARAALACEESLRRNGRPHYLIIDEFNRANQERAFGELFTLLEYRDRPLLPAGRLGRAADLFIPDAFRIIGTLNAEDRNTVFEIGPALRRRFAMVEIGLPSPQEERRLLPRAVKARMPSLLLNHAGDFADPALATVAGRLTAFVAAIRPDPANPAAGGKALGTAPLIEALLFCTVANLYYDQPTEALEDAIMANILPQLERSPQAIKRALGALSGAGPLAELKRVQAALQRMSGY